MVITVVMVSPRATHSCCDSWTKWPQDAQVLILEPMDVLPLLVKRVTGVREERGLD